jgi:hypothetical protein
LRGPQDRGPRLRRDDRRDRACERAARLTCNADDFNAIDGLEVVAVPDPVA